MKNKIPIPPNGSRQQLLVRAINYFRSREGEPRLFTRRKLVLLALTALYAFSPIDLIPDFIPVIGYLDDLILLPLLVALTLKLIPDETFERCREQARQMYQQGMKKHWYYMLPIILIWAILILLVGKLLFF